MAPKDKDAILKQFREQLAQQDLLLDGDTIGTDDATLLYVRACSPHRRRCRTDR